MERTSTPATVAVFARKKDSSELIPLGTTQANLTSGDDISQKASNVCPSVKSNARFELVITQSNLKNLLGDLWADHIVYVKGLGMQNNALNVNLLLPNSGVFKFDKNSLRVQPNLEPANPCGGGTFDSSIGFAGFQNTNTRFKNAIFVDGDTCLMNKDNSGADGTDGIVKLRAVSNEGMGCVIESTGSFTKTFPVGSFLNLNGFSAQLSAPPATNTKKYLTRDASCGNAEGDKIYVELSEEIK